MANKTGTDSAAISAVAGEVPSREDKELIADKHETHAGAFTGRLRRLAWAARDAQRLGWKDRCVLRSPQWGSECEMPSVSSKPLSHFLQAGTVAWEAMLAQLGPAL